MNLNRFLSRDELVAMGFRQVGIGVRVHATVNWVFPENVALHDHCRVDAYTAINASGPVSFGRYVHIAAQCFMSGHNGITFEDFSSFSHGSKMYSANDDYSGAYMTNPTLPREYINVTGGPVVIGRHTIIGANSVVLPNLTIGEGCAIGSLSLVKSSLDPWGIYVGAPVRRVKDRKKDLLELEKKLLAQSPR